MKLTNEELLNINGGGLTASMISAISKGVNSLLNAGRALGSALRRLFGKKLCPI